MTEQSRQWLNIIQAALRNTAEQDHNDIIANSASALAVRLESVGTAFGMKISDLSTVDRQLIEHALAHHRN
jgi:hypothetical protein